MLSHLLGWRNDMRDNLNCTYAHQQYNSIPFFCCYHILRLDSSTSVSKTTETVSSYYCFLKSHSSYKLNENAWLFSVNPTNRFWNLCLFCVFTFLISLSLFLSVTFLLLYRPEDLHRIRVEHMERQLANLTGLVQKALTQGTPTGGNVNQNYLGVPGQYRGKISNSHHLSHLDLLLVPPRICPPIRKKRTSNRKWHPRFIYFGIYHLKFIIV